MSKAKKSKGTLERVTEPVADAAGAAAKVVKRSARGVGAKAGKVLRSVGEAVAEGAEAVREAGLERHRDRERVAPLGDRVPRVEATAKRKTRVDGPGASRPTGSPDPRRARRRAAAALPAAKIGGGGREGQGRPEASRESASSSRKTPGEGKLGEVQRRENLQVLRLRPGRGRRNPAGRRRSGRHRRRAAELVDEDGPAGPDHGRVHPGGET